MSEKDARQWNDGEVLGKPMSVVACGVGEEASEWKKLGEGLWMKEGMERVEEGGMEECMKLDGGM